MRTSFLLGDFLILTLACYRITNLLVDEAGPWDIFHKIRKFAGIYYDRHSQKIADNEFGRMLLCPWCTSMWVGILLGLLWILSEKIVLVCLPFALSTVSILIHIYVQSKLQDSSKS